LSDWFDVNSVPGYGAGLSSAIIRGEFSAIETAMQQLPTYTGNADKIVVVNSGATGLSVLASITVPMGGTGVATMADGGLLLGSGAGAITSMAVLADGEMVVGDGTTDPVAESGATLRTSIGVAIGSDIAAYDADTSLTDVAETRSATINMADFQFIRPLIKDYGIVHNAIGLTGGGTQDIDLELGNAVSATVDTSANTFTFSNPTATDEECGFTLYLTNGGSQTVNWPAATDWENGIAPTLTAAGVDILGFTTVDGGTIWNGLLMSQDSK
jgi:hypothetical protein